MLSGTKLKIKFFTFGVKAFTTILVGTVSFSQQYTQILKDNLLNKRNNL